MMPPGLGSRLRGVQNGGAQGTIRGTATDVRSGSTDCGVHPDRRRLGDARIHRRGPGHGVNVDIILLDQERMRAITGAGEHLTIISSMDGSAPVEIEALAGTTPAACRFLYAETATFGPDLEEFHKITFQDPPDGALISEGAAAYRDTATAQRAFAALVSKVTDCAGGVDSRAFVGKW